jgi:hypothetical protein
MTNIVKFPEPTRRMWVCNCGCSSFELLEVGVAICAMCGAEAEDGGWTAHVPNTAWGGKEPVRQVGGNGDPDFARAVVMRRCEQPDTVCIAVVKECGTLSVWSNAETSEQISVIGRTLRKVRNLIQPRT